MCQSSENMCQSSDWLAGHVKPMNISSNTQKEALQVLLDSFESGDRCIKPGSLRYMLTRKMSKKLKDTVFASICGDLVCKGPARAYVCEHDNKQIPHPYHADTCVTSTGLGEREPEFDVRVILFFPVEGSVLLKTVAYEDLKKTDLVHAGSGQPYELVTNHYMSSATARGVNSLEPKGLEQVQHAVLECPRGLGKSLFFSSFTTLTHCLIRLSSFSLSLSLSRSQV